MPAPRLGWPTEKTETAPDLQEGQRWTDPDGNVVIVLGRLEKRATAAVSELLEKKWHEEKTWANKREEELRAQSREADRKVHLALGRGTAFHFGAIRCWFVEIVCRDEKTGHLVSFDQQDFTNGLLVPTSLDARTDSSGEQS